MAAINDLIAQIQDVELRNKIEQEVNRMNKQKKFGLVFEEHLPECTPLYEMPVNYGSNVALKSGKLDLFSSSDLADVLFPWRKKQIRCYNRIT